MTRDSAGATSQRKLNPIAGWSLILLGVVIALAGITLLFWFLSGKNGISPVLWFIGGLLNALGLGLAARLVHLGRRMLAQGVPELLNYDKRAPVLYLRPFKDDGVANFASSFLRSRRKLYFGGLFRRTYEQRLAHVLQYIGPFIAVGNPSENRPQLGAARLYVPDAKWKSTVSQLLDESQLVVLHAGESEGLLWELGEVFKIVNPLKIIISLPMDEKRGETIEKARYEKFRERSADIFPHPLPEADSGAQFLYFDRDWNPSLLVPVRGQQLPAMRAGGYAAGEIQSRVLNGLRREFLRVSSPYWVRMLLMLSIFLVGGFIVFFIVLAGFDVLWNFAGR